MLMIRLILPVIIVVISLISSCSGVRPACINESNKDMVIRWGEQEMKTGRTWAFQLNTEAVIFRYTIIGAGVQLEEVGELDQVLYCNTVHKIRNAMLKTQALSVPADTIRFVEFINPKMGAEMKAFWNPEFETYGSALFREIYDSLQVYAGQVK